MKVWLFRAAMLLVVLLALEVFARGVRLLIPAPDESYGYPDGLYVWDADTEYRFKPGFRGFFEGGPFREIPLEINSAGFRDDEFPAARTPGVARIVFLGDSVTFGSGVRAEERFSARLRGAAPYETLNLAINSYGAWHYARQARALVPALGPDHVVIGLCLNDLEPNWASWPGRVAAVESTGGVARAGVRTPAPDEAERFHWSDGSGLAWIAKELETRWRNRDPWAAWMTHIGKLWKKERLERGLREHLAAIRDALAAQDIALTVLVLPEVHDLDDPARFGLPRQRAVAMLEALGIPHLDLHQAFRSAPDRRALFLPGDAIHLSPQGHALVAAQLEAWLAQPVAAR